MEPVYERKPCVEAECLASAETPRIIDEATGRVRPPFAPAIAAYWRRRHELFSRYDDGIRVDAASWFSVTPEQIAIAHAAMCAAPAGVAIDAFAGVGGNAIQLAAHCAHVMAIEIEPGRAALLAHNARVYGVAARIDVIAGSFYELAHRLRADVLFLSPPWGGPDYQRDRPFDVEADLAPPLSETLDLARRIAPRCVVFLPRNCNRKRLVALARRGESCSLTAEADARGRPCALTAVFELVLGLDKPDDKPAMPPNMHVRFD